MAESDGLGPRVFCHDGKDSEYFFPFSLFYNMPQLVNMAAIGFAPWERTLCTFKTSRAEDISGFAWK